MESQLHNLVEWPPARFSVLGWMELPIEPFYETLDTLGLKFGPAFRSLKKVWTENRLWYMKLNPLPVTDAFYFCHPVCIDAMIQAFIFASSNGKNPTKLRVPISIGSFSWFSTTTAPHSVLVKDDVVELFGQDRTLIATMQGELQNFYIVVFFNSQCYIGLDTVATTVADVERAIEEFRVPMMFDSVWEQSLPSQLGSLSRCCAFMSNEQLEFKNLIKVADCRTNESIHYEYIKTMDRAVVLHFLVALQEMSWNKKLLQLDDFVKENNIESQNILMIRRFCEMLTEDGYMTNIDELSYKVCKSLPTLEKAHTELKDLHDIKDDRIKNGLMLVKNCMNRYNFEIENYFNLFIS
jgi:hypothetical protein